MFLHYLEKVRHCGYDGMFENIFAADHLIKLHIATKRYGRFVILEKDTEGEGDGKEK